MSEFSEGMAVGQAMRNNETNVCYPMGGYGGFGNGWGGDGWWILLLLLAGWGNNGWGGNGGNQNLGYELGRIATTNDVASGFSTSTIMSNQRDLQLGQQQGFADVQQTLCQGFSGVNATVNQVGNQINQGICNLGYTIQGGFNSLGHQISDCCCDLKTLNLENRYLNEKQTCEIIGAINNGNQRLLDYWNCKENQSLRDDLQAARFQLSQLAQNSTLINELRPTARPAYLTCSPYESVYGYGRGNYGGGCCNNGCC